MKTTLTLKLIALTLIFSVSSYAARVVRPTAQAIQTAEQIIVPEGTEFAITPVEEVNSKISSEGDPVTFRVVDDVVVNDKVVVKAGTVVKGIVSDLEKRGMLGKAGKISIRVEKTTTVDGQPLRLRAVRAREGGSNTGKVIALTLLVSPLFLLMRGNTARIKPGMKIQVYTDEEKKVSLIPTSQADIASRRMIETSQPQSDVSENTDLNGIWNYADGYARIAQQRSDIQVALINPSSCNGVIMPLLFKGQLQGGALSGTYFMCTNQKLVTDCGFPPISEAAISGRVNNQQINATLTIPGMNLVSSIGTNNNCTIVRDRRQDSQYPISLTRVEEITISNRANNPTATPVKAYPQSPASVTSAPITSTKSN